MRLHRQQPTRLPHPWDSPGKNTGEGCHFLLQGMKVKSESEDAQLSPTLHDPIDCSPPDSSLHEIFQARVLEWGAIAFSDIYLAYFNLAFSFLFPTLLQWSFPMTLLLLRFLFSWISFQNLLGWPHSSYRKTPWCSPTLLVILLQFLLPFLPPLTFKRWTSSGFDSRFFFLIRLQSLLGNVWL